MRARNRSWRAAARLSLAVAALAAGAGSARGLVFVNEIRVHGIEAVELFSSGPTPLDLTNWRLEGSNGIYMIPPGTIINPGQYLTLSNLGNIMDEIGGETSLIDFAGGLQDRVQYGDEGGAPLPHPAAGISLARAPDGAANPPRDPADDALLWTIDFSLTFNAPNDAPAPQLGSTIRVNEIDDSAPDTDTVEFFNPSAIAIDIPLVGWILTDGTTQASLTGVVMGGGVIALTLPTSIETTRLAYLFNPAGVRVDQVGYAGGPVALEEPCIGRCPDGGGPSNGYDYETTGGGTTWLPLTCSAGASNNFVPGCYTSSVPDEEPAVLPRGWGEMKRGYLLR
jgi:hypothetical protein